MAAKPELKHEDCIYSIDVRPLGSMYPDIRCIFDPPVPFALGRAVTAVYPCVNTAPICAKYDDGVGGVWEPDVKTAAKPKTRARK